MKNRFSLPILAAIVAVSLSIVGCENGNLFGGLNNRGGDGSVSSLLADAQVTLDSGDYSRALALYEEILSKDGDNSEALYGAAAAALGASGLNFGQLLSNVISQQGVGALGLADFIDLAKTGIGSSTVGSNVDSILANIDLTTLNNVIDCVLYRLNLIAAGAGDGSIGPRDVDLLINFGITCLIRGILRPLRENFLDLKNVNGTLVLEIVPTTAKSFCDNPSNASFIQTLARDAATAFALINEAVNQLGLASGSNNILVQIRDDISQAATDLLSTAGGANGTTSALPASCISAMSPITASNFQSEGAQVFTTVPSTNPCP